MAPLYFPKLIQINYDLMLRIKKWLIYAKFGADLINISKGTSRKTKRPRFFAYPVHPLQIQSPQWLYRRLQRNQWLPFVWFALALSWNLTFWTLKSIDFVWHFDILLKTTTCHVSSHSYQGLQFTVLTHSTHPNTHILHTHTHHDKVIAILAMP